MSARKKATDFGYCTVRNLQCGTPIYLYGWRKVVDVHNVCAAEGGPQKVRLVTNDGRFLMDRNSLIATEPDEQSHRLQHTSPEETLQALYAKHGRLPDHVTPIPA